MVNSRLLCQINNNNKSKVITGIGIYERGGTLVDVETAYRYELSYNRYFTGVFCTLLDKYVHGCDTGAESYDRNLG